VGLGIALAVVAVAATVPASAPAGAQLAFIRSAEILVPGDLENRDCRTGVCQHNENTDLTRKGDIYLAHRTAGSQVLGPNSSLRVYRSENDGESFELRAIIPAPPDRDIRDPHFYQVGKRLHIKAITRLPGFALRDTGAGSISIETHSRNGKTWRNGKRWKEGAQIYGVSEDTPLETELIPTRRASGCSRWCGWTGRIRSCSARRDG
jgi:hypothetical protein